MPMRLLSEVASRGGAARLPLSDSTLEDVRIVCISGMVEEDKVQELRLAGADDFLHKPFDIEVLIDRMCAQLDIEPAPATA